MKRVIVRYTVKSNRAEENADYVRKVFAAVNLVGSYRFMD